MKTGTIKTWSESKGFGFIYPKSGGKDVFAHISGYSKAHKRPYKGLQVHYSLSTDPKGRQCAVEIRPAKGHKNNGHELRQKSFAILLAAIMASALGLLYSFKFITFPVIAMYTGLSLITFIIYAKDKSAAQQGEWRTPESTLHTLALLGGWPGAALAQGYLRHKSKKFTFRVIYRGTVIVNCIGLYWITTPNGQAWISKILQ